MSNVKNDCRFFFVVKVSGENDGRHHRSGEGLGPNSHCFVAGNCFFITERQAMDYAAKLAQETPGNRYYVVRPTIGFMSELKLHQVDYELEEFAKRAYDGESDD